MTATNTNRLNPARKESNHEALSTNLGLPRLRHHADYSAGGNIACGVVNHAAMVVASGQADAVLVYRALNGASGTRYGGEAFSRLLATTSLYTDAEQHETKLAVEAARKHIEADLHAEMRSLRDELRALKAMLSAGTTAPLPNFTAKENP